MDLKLTLNRIFHGAHHVPTSGRLLRIATLLIGATAAVYTWTADSLLLVVAVNTAVTMFSLAISLELHEAAVACEQADDDQDDGFGWAA